MTLTPGTRLGVYDITAQIGEGAMGKVFRATDTKLKRQVAIKILPPAVAADAERLARFQREAEVLASLNHPNIAAIYGLEESGGITALVMELVEGDDLSQRVARGGIQLDEALPIAEQITEALEAAHEQGIIHRDLKPANIKVRSDGTVKVLDFGLAKAMEPAAGSSPSLSMSPTITTPAMTQAGVILGTAAYMSPEQARGRPVDTRTDIWAFGCVLFEMLTGVVAFPGSDVAEVLSAVIQIEPAYARLLPDVPDELRRLIERCLQKNPRNRLRHIGDARNLLEEIAQGPREGQRVPTGRRGWRWWRVAPWALVAALAVALAVSFAGASRSTSPGAPLRRFALDVPSKSAPNWGDFDVAVSPDSTRIAYNCRDGNTVSLCVRPLDSLIARPVTDGSDLSDWFFSPDGEWIGLVDTVGVSKVSIRGGQPQTIHRWLDTEPAARGFSWGPDGYILFGTSSGIQRVAASGGSPEAVTRIGAGVKDHAWPAHLPDGRRALFTIVRADGSETGALVDLKDGSVRDLGIRGRGFVYMPPRWLAFQQGTTVLAAAFDPDNPTRAASPVPVLEGVLSLPHVALDGTLAYIPTRGESSARLVWVDREGRPTAIAGERRDYSHLDLAPDNRRALLNIDGGSIYLLDLQAGTRKLLAQGEYPIWSPDGGRVTFAGRGGLQWQPADGSAAAELVVASDGSLVPTSWNALTGDLAYYDGRTYEIRIRSTDGKTRGFLGRPGRKRSGRFSPNGKWMAFVSDETGEYQVYVTAYPGPGPTVAVSTKGGLSPIWSADGSELFFRLGSKVLAARISSAQPLGFSVPVELFDGPYTLDLMGHQREDVTADGRSFLMVENSDDFPIVVVQNWALELGRVAR